jgi:hypothetical protein
MTATYRNTSRRIGVEMEYNAMDGENRSRGENDLPVGIYDFANIIKNTILKCVDVTKWQYTNNNYRWAVKPDSSCGVEVCSPPRVANLAIEDISKVVESLTSSGIVKSDFRCSFHVHVEIADLTESQIVLLIKKWVAAELFFFMLTNPTRWLNQYCMPVGFFCEFDTQQTYFYSNILHKFSETKYYSVNLYHFGKGKKKTIEFRIMGNEACLSGEDAENWCKLLTCFVDRASKFAGVTRTTFEYDSFTDVIDFLSLDTYFEDASVIQWMIEKLSNTIDNTDFEVYTKSKFFWKNLLEAKREEIMEVLARLESVLK